MKTNIVRCDLCHTEVDILGNLSERDVRVIHTCCSEWEDVTLTVLECPSCGKESIVQVDNQGTKELLYKVKELYLKRAKFAVMGKPVPVKLSYKIGKADGELGRMRAALAKRLDGALYQFEGDIHQLDYRYHAR